MANSNYDPEKGVERIEKVIQEQANREAALSASSTWQEAEVTCRKLKDIRGYRFGQDIAYFISKLSTGYWLHCTGTFYLAKYISRGGILSRVPEEMWNYLGMWQMFAEDYINTDAMGYWRSAGGGDSGDVGVVGPGGTTNSEIWVERVKVIPKKSIQNGLYYQPRVTKFELLSPAQSELSRENRYIIQNGNWAPGTIIEIYSSLWNFDKYDSKNKFIAHMGSRHYSECNEGTFGELVTVADAALAVATGFKVKKIMKYPEFIPGGKW